MLIPYFLFDASPYLKTIFLRVGYYERTAVFVWHTLVYGYAALARS